MVHFLDYKNQEIQKKQNLFFWIRVDNFHKFSNVFILLISSKLPEIDILTIAEMPKKSQKW